MAAGLAQKHQGNLKRWYYETPLKPVDIHSIDTDNRLVVQKSDKESLQFLDASLPGSVVVAKAVDKMVNWTSDALEKRTIETIDPLLLPFYRKLEGEGKIPLQSSPHIYRDVLLRLLRKFFGVESKLVPNLFTHWVICYPKVESLLDAERSNPAERSKKLDLIPGFRDPDVRKKSLNVLAGLNKFDWKSVSSAAGDFQPAPEITKFLHDSDKTPFTPTDLEVQQKDQHIGRLVSRLCRIGIEVSSPPARRQVEDTLEKLKSSPPIPEIDIEDHLLLVATRICTEKSPRCTECPLTSICNAYKDSIAGRLFLKLYQRHPAFLSYSITPTCRDGLECLLCAQDEVVDCFKTLKPVERYPVTQSRLQRRHEAVFILRHKELSWYAFPSLTTAESMETPTKRGRKRKIVVDVEETEQKPELYVLWRMDLEADQAPSSEASLIDFQDKIARELSCLSFTLKRDCRADYRREDAAAGTVHLVYVYVVAFDPLPGSTLMKRPCLKINPAKLMPDVLKQEDWTLFQNFLFFEQLPPSEYASHVQGRRRDPLNPRTRLTMLEEAYGKRFNVVQYPK